MSDPVQPVPHHRPRRDARRLPDENEKGGLEGILGVVVAQQAAAHAPHHRPVPLDEGSKGRFVVMFDETAEQFTVAKPGTITYNHLANVVDHAVHSGRHVPPPTSVPALFLPFICSTMLI
jgi:hypothetical protein